MAAFGVPRSHGDDPDRAIAASLALVERVERARRRPGRADRHRNRRGALTAPAEADLSVTGEAVNAAARLQQAAEPGEVLVGERSALAARNAQLGPMEPKQVKGFAEPLRAARAIDVEGPGRSSAGTPFIGRDEDLDLLRLVYRRAARARVPELITITGEAGVGKTRLATELVDALRVEDPSPEVVVGRNPALRARDRLLGARRNHPRCRWRRRRTRTSTRYGPPCADRLAAAGAEDADEIAGVLASAVGGHGVHAGSPAPLVAADGRRPGRAVPPDRRGRRRPLGRRRLPRPDRGVGVPASAMCRSWCSAPPARS